MMKIPKTVVESFDFGENDKYINYVRKHQHYGTKKNLQGASIKIATY